MMKRLTMIALMLWETVTDPGPTEKDTVMLDEEVNERGAKNLPYPLNEKVSLSLDKREIRLLTYEALLRSWVPWTRKGKMVKRMTEKLLKEVRSGPRDTGSYSS